VKVIIAGSRDITDYSIVKQAWLDSGLGMTELVSGGARGVDNLGLYLAVEELKIPFKLFIPDWDTHGRKAGIIRNVEMAWYADALIAVWDGKSRGTEHMINFMKLSLGKPTYVLNLKEVDDKTPSNS
jgi:hypothetical protein